LATVFKIKNRRLILVIGDILELGNIGKSVHQLIGEFLYTQRDKVNYLVTVGKNAKYIGMASQPRHWDHFDNSNDISSYLNDYIRKEDLILIQGSNAIGLETVVDDLTKNRKNVAFR
jgi:UDP-N-acetylmuramoyl-tripeptide--D-alanyl-D-alanine ligase